MTREYMKRSAADNEYLHKDFHGALSEGVEYLHRQYGPEAVREFLHDFTIIYYAPLRTALQQQGLPALKEFFETLYRTEGGEIEINCTEDELVLRVAACPAVTHLRQRGLCVAELFHETTKTVNEALCEGSDFTAELVDYDPQTGRSVQKFVRRAS